MNRTGRPAVDKGMRILLIASFIATGLSFTAPSFPVDSEPTLTAGNDKDGGKKKKDEEKEEDCRST